MAASNAPLSAAVPMVQLAIASARASSVLNRNARLHGPSFVLDDRPDTCWYSDAGSPQELELVLVKPARLGELRVTFACGFAGGDACELHAMWADALAPAGDVGPRGDVADGGAGVERAAVGEVAAAGATSAVDGSSACPAGPRWALVARFDAEDVNGEQAFTLDDCGRAAARVRVVFPRSTDFYGRVVVNRLRLLGWVPHGVPG